MIANARRDAQSRDRRRHIDHCGSLRSTGSVYVVNQAALVVGPGGKGRHRTAASSPRRATFSNATFMAGGNVDLSGSSSGTIDNQGSITSTNGNVILVGNRSRTADGQRGQGQRFAGGRRQRITAGQRHDAVLVETGSGDVTYRTVEAGRLP